MEPESKIHICATVFTGRGLNDGFKGDDWYKLRISVFKKYVVENLRGNNIVHWIMFRPEEKDNPLTIELLNYLDGIKYNYKATFHGQCWWDDKRDNSTLKERLALSLKELDLPKTDYVYLTQLDSDDLLAFGTIDLIQKEPFKINGALYCTKGYIYDISQSRLADWECVSVETFTLMYPYEIFTDAEKHLAYQNGWTTHEQVPELYDAKELPINSYLQITGIQNRSSVWGHKYMWHEYFYENEKAEILKNFIK
jgi:hypothetical protein